MEEKKRMYTVEEIAEMTSLTSRTIRNYMKKGLLKGRKIGGVWRFTDRDIEDLFNQSAFINKISESNKQYVYDFLDNKNHSDSNSTDICTIIDYYCNSKKKALSLFNDIMKSFGERFDNYKIYYEYLEEQSKARYTIFGDIELISEIMYMVKSRIDNI